MAKGDEMEPMTERSGTKSSEGKTYWHDENGAIEPQELILKFMPVIKSIAHQFSLRLPPNISQEELVSAGLVGLMDAVTKFDPKRNVKFKTYANYRIRGAMWDELRALDWAPRSIRQKAVQLNKTIQKIEKESGRKAEDDELAWELGLSLDGYYDMVKSINGMVQKNIGEIDQGTAKLEENNGQIVLEKMETFALSDTLSKTEMENIFAKMIDQLSFKHRTVLSLYYYEELSLKEIGEVLGFTESRICQLHKEAIVKLRFLVKASCQIPNNGKNMGNTPRFHRGMLPFATASP